MCGEIIPEGRQVCPHCEKKYGGSDGTGSQAAILFQKQGSYKQPDSNYPESGS